MRFPLALVALVFACRPSEPGTPPHLAQVTRETRALEPVARRVALALADTEVRVRFHRALAEHPGQTLPLAPLVAFPTVLVALIPLPEHARRWLAEPSQPILVAAGSDGLPIAFDLGGGRHRLDPTRPPRTPVILLSRPDEVHCDRSWLCGPRWP
jgi:hypothetical protein